MTGKVDGAAGADRSTPAMAQPIRPSRLLIMAALAAVAGSAAAEPMPVDDNEIRTAFVGHEVDPPRPWPVSFGPYQFRSDGTFFRQQDLVSASGRYVIADGRICIGPAQGAAADECYKVLRDGSQYFMQDAGGRAPPFAVTLRPLGEPAK